MKRRWFLRLIALAPFIGLVPKVFAAKEVLPKPLTSLDRVGVRRLIIEIKKYILKLSETCPVGMWYSPAGFPRGQVTRIFVIQLEGYLESLRIRGALQNFKITHDLQPKGLLLDVYIQPRNSVEYIVINSIVTD